VEKADLLEILLPLEDQGLLLQTFCPTLWTTESTPVETEREVEATITAVAVAEQQAFLVMAVMRRLLPRERGPVAVAGQDMWRPH
jgi:hypothetical protein